jgi:predicted AlkP superfamily phosphohydrolase/phosphomutase
MKLRRSVFAALALFLLACLPVFSQEQSSAKPKPKVVVIGVNGMELDVIRPLLLQGKMPNLSSVIKKGAYGKLRTVSAPNCPRVYSTLFTSTKPEEHGVTGFIVGGITANTNMLKEEPIWSVLSKSGVTVEWPTFLLHSP